MKEETIKLWITTYALTSGILEVNGLIHSSGLVSYKSNGYTVYISKGGWHRDKASAVKKAREMAKRKIEGLYKQIYKLEALSFA